jgi:hypothetical protein
VETPSHSPRDPEPTSEILLGAAATRGATTEQIDQTAASREASKLEGHEPDIPVTLVGLENPEGDVTSADQYQKLKEPILQAQQRFLDHFPRGSSSSSMLPTSWSR